MNVQFSTKDRFNISDCVDWIDLVGCNYVCLYFLPQFYCLSSDIVLKLQLLKPNVKFIVSISSTSGVDTISLRVRDNDSPNGVIYFGTSCLCLSKYSKNLPILFMSLNNDEDELKYISDCLNDIETSHRRILLATDLTNISTIFSDNFQKFNLHKNSQYDIAKIVKQGRIQNWHFQNFVSNQFEDSDANNESLYYHPFKIPVPLNQYDLVVFIGECQNMEFILNCKQILVIDPQRRISKYFDGPKEFRKRVSLFEKFKNQVQNYMGVVFVNYVDSVSSTMAETTLLCKKLKKIPYFLILNQPDIEIRLGNFSQLEGFVLVNSCICNYDIALNTSKYFFPIIFWKEFLITCGKKVSYGGILWNEDQTELEETGNSMDGDHEKEQVDEENMKLIERDLFSKPDGWFGLIVDPGSNEVSDIKEGKKGIPSSYINEQELF